jgi:hypothetical protein
MTTSRDTVHMIRSASIEGAIEAALAFLLLPVGAYDDIGSVLLVFSGEGRTIGEAIAAALEDIRAQCNDQRCRPIGVVTDGVMATDAGTRIWGTVSCKDGSATWPQVAETTGIALEAKGKGAWTLTILSA